MKKQVIFFIFLFFSVNMHAQFFPYQGVLPTAIPDSNVNIDFPIVISGLPGQVDSSFGLSEVCIDITHPQASDLKISLTSPDSTVIILSLHNGSGGANFTGTCFQMNAFTTIGAGFAPFFGSYIPTQSLNNLNNGQDPNGTWVLSIIDVFPSFAGQINYFALTFGNNPPPDPPLVQGSCTTTNASGCTCKDSTLNDCDLLPDLICSYIIIRDGWNEHVGSIDLPNAVIDIGSGPVEMRPTNICFCDTVTVPCTTTLCPDGSNPKEMVNQRVYHKNPGGAMTFQDTPAGFQSFHPNHNHVHAEDFTEFSLRVATADPDPANWPVLGSSTKMGYCMINMGSCNTTDSICMSHGAVITNSMLPNFDLGIVTGCGSQGQGIFVGRYDLYGAGFGQSIDLTNICNGDYYLVTTIDPLNHFREEDETNNIIAIPVHLTQQAGTALPASFTYQTSGLTVGFFNYTPGVTRTWDFGDGTVLVSNLPSHQYAAAGTYVVKLTVYDSTCAATSAQSITVGTIGVSINDSPSGLNSVEVYPNPAKETLTLSYQLVNPSPIKIEILNLLGEKISALDEEIKISGKHDLKINLTIPGSYLIRMYANDHIINKRVTVVR